jgi:hypothetical protein
MAPLPAGPSACALPASKRRATPRYAYNDYPPEEMDEKSRSLDGR